MVLHACTIFLGAFLLFLVQPIVARAILPWFGGSPAVWTACMLFFQTMLLGGYAYAAAALGAGIARRGPWIHLALLAGTLAFLPIVPDPSWKPQGAELPTLKILGLLAATIGLPYFLLSSSAPLLQAWAWSAARARGGSPYRLYALSNAGSFLALAAYPFGLEPLLDVTSQAQLWSAGYGLYVFLCGWLALDRIRTLRGKPSTTDATAGAHTANPSAPPDPPPPRPDSIEDADEPDVAPPASIRLLWVGLSAVAVVLLLSVTNLMSQEIAVIPFLWMLPLAIYLLTMILCFAGDWWYWRGFYHGLLLPTFFALSLAIARLHKLGVPLGVLLLSAGLFVCCMVCHGELVRLKPHPRRLTSFYLHMAFGGALGGVYVGVLAPWLISFPFELQFGMTACASLTGLALVHRPYERVAHLIPSWLTLALTQGIAAALAASLFVQTKDALEGYHYVRRNFYGVVKVKDLPAGDHSPPLRVIVHGITRHGQQIRIPAQRREPTSYYGRATGIGVALLEHRRDTAQKVGVVGLGAGTIAAYGREGDEYRFYEINPIVERVAREEFSFLGDSPARVDVILGDARLAMESEPDQAYDILALDAFSSDAIPIHLLTIEAFRIYRRHLRADGILAVHVSNRALNLEPVVRAAADGIGMKAVLVSTLDDDPRGVMGADWVLVTSNLAFLDSERVRTVGRPIELQPGLRAWTDVYGNLLQILK